MKDKVGCFIKAMVLSTILVGAAAYFVINYGPGLFRDFVSGMVVEDLKEKTDIIKDSPQKDSLINFVESYIDTFQIDHIEINSGKVENFLNMVSDFASDSAITDKELEKLVNYFENDVFNRNKKIIKYEEGTKDGN